jgi:hypothetical protein
MAGVPMTSWYCLITSSGVGPVKMYRSTRPPITLHYGTYSVQHIAAAAAAWLAYKGCLITSSGVGPVKMYRSTTPPITLQQ